MTWDARPLNNPYHTLTAWEVIFTFVSKLVYWSSVGGFFHFFIDWFQKREKQNQLEKENAGSKLALLKSQINPHFLFNTLHNIDALIAENQQKASEALLKLSDIMRYMVYDSQPAQVPLKREVEHIKNYVELEKLRIANPDFSTFHVTGSLEGTDIAPMLFIPFVENAFKHSVNTKQDNGIVIELDAQPDRIQFNCQNQYEERATEKDATSGIGLDTLKKRLQYIYPNRHTLNLIKAKGTFTAQLEIQL